MESAADAIEALKESRKTVASARRLAESSPRAKRVNGRQVGYRPLPARIRKELESVARRIDQSIERIQAVPVTRDERNERRARSDKAKK